MLDGVMAIGGQLFHVFQKQVFAVANITMTYCSIWRLEI